MESNLHKLVNFALNESNKFFPNVWYKCTKVIFNHHSSIVVEGLTIQVPIHLCRPLSTTHAKSYAITPSALLAMFDETSTIKMLAVDRNYRTGVSIQLSVEIFQDCFQGDELIMTTKVDKIGKAIGFCTMELKKVGSDDIVAQGKHIKYMNHGFFWNLVFNSFMLPFVIYILSIIFQPDFLTSNIGKLFSLLSIKLPKAPLHPSFDRESGIFQEFNVKPIEKSNSYGSISSFEFQVKPYMTNYFGILHGGALSFAIEEACCTYRTSQMGLITIDPKANIRINPTSVSIRYLLTMSGILQININSSQSSPGTIDEGSNGICLLYKVFGSVINKKNGNLCAEFVVSW